MSSLQEGSQEGHFEDKEVPRINEEDEEESQAGDKLQESYAHSQEN